MKIHLRQIPQGGSLHVENSEDARFLGLEEVEAHPISPLHYALEVGLSGGGFFATGRLSLRYSLQVRGLSERIRNRLDHRSLRPSKGTRRSRVR